MWVDTFFFVSFYNSWLIGIFYLWLIWKWNQNICLINSILFFYLFVEIKFIISIKLDFEKIYYLIWQCFQYPLQYWWNTVYCIVKKMTDIKIRNVLSEKIKIQFHDFKVVYKDIMETLYSYRFIWKLGWPIFTNQLAICVAYKRSTWYMLRIRFVTNEHN